MILAVILSIFTALVLLLGIIAMMRGEKFSRKYSTKLMSLRVVFQAAAIAVLLVIYLYFSK